MLEQVKPVKLKRQRKPLMWRILATFILTFLLAEVEGQDSVHCDNLTRFTCDDGICISKARVCDGYWDCDGGEDEFDCDLHARCYGRNRRMANLNKYKCGKQCIVDSDCRSDNKACKCDDECGLTCITSGVECSKKPPAVHNSVGYKIHRRTPGKPAVSLVKGGPYYVGDVAKYQCKEGMKLVGPLPRCNVKGRWSREIPRCVISDPLHDKTVSYGQFYKVVGGMDASENAWPWQVLLTRKGSTPEQTLGQKFLRGGGTLLNKKWVLTAAHIFLSSTPSSLVISIGVFERPLPGEKISRSVQMFTPSTVYIHDDYSVTAGLNDIALLKIGAKYDFSMLLQDDTSGVTFSPNVKPVHLPCTSGHGKDYENSMNVVNKQFIERCLLREKFQNQNTNKKDVVVTGFGHTEKYDGISGLSTINPPKYLQQATLTLGDEKTCRKGVDDMNNKTRFQRFSYSEKLLCTISNTADACAGDSGGPLLRKMTVSNSRSTRWVQIGIVSYGLGCAADNPGYYTNVARYINWINETIEKDYERDQKADMNRKISKLSSALENFQNILAEMGKLKTENRDLKEALNETQKVLSHDIQDLTTRNRDLIEAVSETQKTLSQDIQHLKSENTALKESMNETQETLNQDIEDLKTENKDLRESLNETKETLNQEIQDVKTDNRDLKESLDETEKTLDKEIQDLKDENKALKQELNETLKTLSREIQDSKEDNRTLEVLNATSQTPSQELQDLKTENRDLKESLNETQETLGHVTEGSNSTKTRVLKEASNETQQEPDRDLRPDISDLTKAMNKTQDKPSGEIGDFVMDTGDIKLNMNEGKRDELNKALDDNEEIFDQDYELRTQKSELNVTSETKAEPAQELKDLKTENEDLNDASNESEETMSQGNCTILYKNKCFLPIFNKKVHKDKAEIICAEMGGRLANIYDENHFQSIRSALQTNHMEGAIYVKLWLGMTYNATTEEVFLSDGSEAKYVNWVPGSPKHKPNHNSVVLEVVQRTSDDVTLSMWNVGLSRRNNPFCEI